MPDIELKIIDENTIAGKTLKVYATSNRCLVPYFLAMEVAECVGYAKSGSGYDTTHLLERVHSEGKEKCLILGEGPNRKMWFLNKKGLYDFLISSRKPIAVEMAREYQELMNLPCGLPQHRHKAIYRDVPDVSDSPAVIAPPPPSQEVQPFIHPDYGEVRTIMRDGEPWFVGKDVATSLGYTNPTKAIKDHIDDEDKLMNESLVSLGQRGGWLINESGLYSLILSSKLPSAKVFKRWVTSEVLPSIRKTGSYGVSTDLSPTLQMLISLEMEQKRQAKAIELTNQRLDTICGALATVGKGF